MPYYCYLWLLFILSPTIYTQTTDKYTDENRPYKFGFNIEGYQHRQEQKDEKGIIKGEYGFITADGYYRVTVYATDENGDFRIISMKNYYVGFPPENPTTTPGSPTQRQGGGGGGGGGEGGLSSFGGINEGRNDERNRGLGGTNPAPKQPVRPQGLAACSDCYVPTTTTTTKPLFGFNGINAGKGISGGAFSNGPGAGPRTGQGERAFGEEQAGRERFPGPINLNNIPDTPLRSNFEKGKSPALHSNVPGSFQDASFPGTPGLPGAPGIPGSQYFNNNDPRRPNAPGGGFFPPENTGLIGGQVNALQNNRLDNEPKRKPQIGEVRDGLPPGVPLSAIKDLLLYRFNYTVGFHGHHEDGYRNGDKEGDYFFDGRDGVERRVEYLANEFGYQPNITLTDLQENDVRRPKEETEKEYGLKGYEFKWFYRK